MDTLDMERSNGRHDNLTDGLPTPVMAIDRDFLVTYMNPAGASLVGLTPESVKGRKCYDLFKTQHCRTDQCRCGQAMRFGDTRSGETVAAPNGTELPIHYTGAPLKDDKDNIVGAVEFVLDISSTKAAMAEAQKKVDNLNSIPTPVMTIDKEYNVTYINPAGARVVGLTPETATGKKCYHLFRTPHCRTPECRCAQAMERDEIRTGETVADPSGLNMPIRYTGAPVRDEKGKIIGALEYVIDVTIEKQVQSGVTAEAVELSKVVESVTTGSAKMERDTVTVAEQTSSVVSAAEELSATMASLASGAEQSERNVSSVATATEEMTATVAEVARNSQNALGVAEQAVKSVEKASEKVAELGQAAKQISKVTETIVEIADQTKLLALNATIEAARAGEAGKGFAVVASEVKELAQQTNSATTDIRAKIEAIQEATTATIDQIQNITKVIQEVNEFVSSIATATEEQSITTKDISTNIAEVTEAVKDMTKNITEAAAVTQDVAGNINRANQAIAEIKSSAVAMNESGAKLKQTEQALLEQVSKF